MFAIEAQPSAVEDCKFKRVLLEAIDESLNKTFGGSATQTIYFLLEKKRHLKPKNIPDNLRDFLYILEIIFGIGALVIEMTIMENLYSRLNLNNRDLIFKHKYKEQFNFIDYTKNLRRIYVKQAVNASSVVAFSIANLKRPMSPAEHEYRERMYIV